MPSQTMITPELLLTRIGTPDAPVLIDVCIDEDFALDPRLIPGAFRYPFSKIENLATELNGCEVVVICQKGLKLSQGAAAVLRAHGVNALALSGGMAHWVEAGLPAIPAAALPNPRIVAEVRPKPDTLATLWLIKRFVNRNAHFLFVSPDAVSAVTDRFDATAAPSFAEALADYDLCAPALSRLQRALSGDGPLAPGIATVLSGLRALHSDDLTCVEVALPLFDALHRAFADASADAEGAAA